MEKLSCNACGAPLEIPGSANFVTCKHCSTQLSVCRTEDVSYTEQINRLADRTDELSQQVENLTIQNEIAALDRDWESTRQQLMISNKEGVRRVPTQAGAIVSGVAACMFGVIWLLVTSNMLAGGGFGGPAGLLPMAGVVFICVGVGSSAVAWNKAIAYQRAEEQYQRRRRELLSK